MQDQDANWVLADAEMPLSARIILGLAALIPLWGFYDMIVRPWPQVASLGGIPFLFIGFVAFDIAVLLLAGAILAPRISYIVDEEARMMVAWHHTWLTGWRRRRYPFATITKVEVVEVVESDGPNTWALHIGLSDRNRPLVIATAPLGLKTRLDILADRLRAAL